jgi:putative DNA primase/helicase
MLLMLYGKGANGKSTFLNALIDLLGPGYAMQAADGLLMAKNSESHPTDRADLYGKRFVSSVEVDDNRRLAESRVKQLTGGDAIRARRMREDFWQFKPTHKLWLAANHMPVIKGTDLGIWRRVKLVPFTVTIPISERDPDLPAKLAAERAGILAWAVRGCLDWQREGLAEPEEVTAATDEYRDEMDTLGEFLAGHCIEGSAYTTRAADMLKAYSSWCYDAGEKQIGQRRLGKALSERGFERYTNNGTWYRGIGLRYGTNGTNGTNGTIPLFHPIRAHA